MTESSQRPIPQLVRITLARFREFDDAFGDCHVNNARLPSFIKVLTGGLERFAHGFCCLVIKHRTQFSFFGEPDNGCHGPSSQSQSRWYVLPFAHTRAGTLDVDQWPALRGRSEEAHGPTA